ncbi:monovalent cation/H+ antiporter complex subunit F [Yimella sp. NH-Cas1]|uniref:monovalent cation/H+ antiporter complex subunit F n=1 Tax=Yimella sp. NH-Cas1 TaxID=2917726 RepID=UPI001EFBC0F8|nr:monovalent cation/H+ antiporter complex subunit F [Yimella sp. NH-Cas1]MCG8656441.1 monovalent cation/H+ antiporter complex subunit F [Yimella sp. NH-Cas1]
MILVAHVIIGIAAVVLFASALIAVGRIAHGPSQLDRSVAADLMVAVVIASVGLWAAYSDSSTEINVLLLLSMLGFTSAVAVSRMVADRMVSRRRYEQTHHSDQESTS